MYCSSHSSLIHPSIHLLLLSCHLPSIFPCYASVVFKILPWWGWGADLLNAQILLVMSQCSSKGISESLVLLSLYMVGWGFQLCV